MPSTSASSALWYNYNIISKKGDDGNMQVTKVRRKEPNPELERIANAKLEDLELEVDEERKSQK